VGIREAIKLAATGQSDAVMPMIPQAAVHNQKVE
jgi:hypothetical protein